MKRLCLIVGLCLAHSSYAKTSKPQVAQQETEASAARESVAEPVPRVQDSEYNRGRNKYSVTALMGFRSDPVGTEVGLTGSYLLNPNGMLNLSFSSLDATINEKSDVKIDGRQTYYVGVKTELKGSAYAVTYKHFLTNTFYVEGGAEYMHAKGEFKISKDLFYGIEEDVEADVGTYDRISGVIHIGNQWQWSSFTLGTSWIGAIVPLSYAHDFKQEDSEDLPKSVKEFRKGESQSQASILKFYLGWSF